MPALLSLMPMGQGKACPYRYRGAEPGEAPVARGPGGRGKQRPYGKAGRTSSAKRRMSSRKTSRLSVPNWVTR